MSIVKESVCGNKHFRSCDVDNGKCVNCGTSYLKKGDFIKSKCQECSSLGKHKVVTIWDGDFRTTCKNCLDNDIAISDLYGNFVGEWVMYEHLEGQDKTFTNDQMTERLNSIVDKIAVLPKDQLKTFLRGVHGGIER